MPTVSVVMAMQNVAPFIFDAVSSVLEQRFVDFELVVVDDGSTDGSRGMVEGKADSRIRIVDGPWNGVAAAKNTGIQAARGNVIVFCDADDILPRERLMQQVDWLKGHQQFGGGLWCICHANAQGEPSG